MELRQLKYFVAVAEELHFGRAAERLMIVQSAVSQQVARLERELRVELFDRSPRHVRLTEAGEAFLPAAREVLDAERRALTTIERFTDGRETVLRVGTSRGMGQRLERVLERLVAGTRVELLSASPEERLRRVADGRLDAAFVRGDVTAPDGVRLIPVWQDPLLVALPAHHPPAEAAGDPVADVPSAGIDLAELAGLPLYLVGREVNPPLVALVREACRDAGFEPVPGPPHSSLQDTLAALGAGIDGWTVIYAAAAGQLRGGRVAFLPVRSPYPLSLPTVLAVGGTTRARPLVEACRAVVRDDRES
ncbi:LysR family transcriptional regulator [Microbispora sp. H10830]|uniref:LysR family transcriptional regulator n=1 Tax=Microbispora sp. H10830 TaxID=2729109 RepID=UPI00160181A0|nr:LysR family transcriptional regulator [Microbispora sp. H10830]